MSEVGPRRPRASSPSRSADVRMTREVQRYVTRLLEVLLGPAETEKSFDWCRGDSRSGDKGRRLPFDAVWESRKLIVEVDESQHSEAVPFFDKPGVPTAPGVHRGEQRRRYDERKERLAVEHGYTLVRVPTSILAHKERRLFYDRMADIRAVRLRIERQDLAIGQVTGQPIVQSFFRPPTPPATSAW